MVIIARLAVVRAATWAVFNSLNWSLDNARTWSEVSAAGRHAKHIARTIAESDHEAAQMVRLKYKIELIIVSMHEEFA